MRFGLILCPKPHTPVQFLQIGSGNLLEAVEFGQTTVSPAAKTAEDQQLLEDVGALIAYAGALLGGRKDTESRGGMLVVCFAE